MTESPSQLPPPLLSAQPPTRIYLLGAGGCGMSGLGHLLLDLGHPVAGSDLLENEESRQLRARGATIALGHAREHILREKPGLVVYSSAVPADNPERRAALEAGIATCRRAHLLADLLKRKRGVCVAGMHGKTTTSALLAFALDRLQTHPSFAVGSLVPQLAHHARFDPDGEFFVVETDESDGTLSAFHPETAIVLNVDEEHLDYFADLEAVCREFRQFARQATGWVLWCADDPRLADVVAGCAKTLSYGYAPGADYRVELAEPSPAGPAVTEAFMSRFKVWHQGQCLGEFPLDRLQGEKNVSNAAAVVAWLHQHGFGASEIAAAIRPFRGAARRQQRLYQGPEAMVIDDYGHHPREIVATLQALKPANGRRLLVAFQPHRYTRTQHLMREFSGCFGLADRLWLAEIYPASEKPIPGVTSQVLAEAIRARGQAVQYVPEVDHLAAAVKAALEPGDTVLFLGAGDITRAARILAAGLRAGQAAVTARIYAGLTRLLTPGTVLRRDEPMSKHTTFRVGGPAEFYVEPVSEEDLGKLLAFCAAQQVPCRVIGRGSNLLVRDGGLRGVVVCLAAPFGGIEIQGRQVRCGAGARLREVVMAAKNHELGGLDFLEGIPGSVGGAMRMNAGAMGRQFYQVVERVRYLDRNGAAHECPAADLPVAYRGCPFFRDHIALEAVLTGVPTPKPEIEAKLAESNHQRWTSQPAAPSAGCVFKNPPNASAGQVIDELGLKKLRAGGALVSPVHANFIVNDGHATARDVLDLIEKVRGIVRSRAGLELETEVEIVGEEPEL